MSIRVRSEPQPVFGHAACKVCACNVFLEKVFCTHTLESHSASHYKFDPHRLTTIIMIFSPNIFILTLITLNSVTNIVGLAVLRCLYYICNFISTVLLLPLLARDVVGPKYASLANAAIFLGLSFYQNIWYFFKF